MYFFKSTREYREEICSTRSSSIPNRGKHCWTVTDLVSGPAPTAGVVAVVVPPVVEVVVDVGLLIDDE